VGALPHTPLLRSSSYGEARRSEAKAAARSLAGPLRRAPLSRGRAVRADVRRHDSDILVWRRMTDYIVVCALELKVALRYSER
jgi:hypothetical protein